VNESSQPFDPAENLDEQAQLEQMLPAPIRADLIVQKQNFKNEEYFVIKDPLALTYFRMRAEEAFIVSLLDGKRNLKSVAEIFFREYPNSSLTLKDMATFIHQLGVGGLLNISARRFVDYARSKPKMAQSLLMLWTRIISKLIFFKIPLVDPSPWLSKLTARITFIWTPWFIWSCLGFIAWTIFWLIVNIDAFSENTISFLSPSNLFLLWILLILIKTCHEFGHATTCRNFGGEVHEMGLCFICFTPCGYVDASDAWMMREKKHKIYTTLAGIFTEFVIASVAVYFWLYLPEGLFKNIAFNAMVVASINTLFFNMNPLMKFDGYYIISDMLEIPNLRTKSITYCSYRLQKFFFGIRNIGQEKIFEDERNSRTFIIYALCAFAYMGFIIYSLSQIFARVLQPYGLGEFGLGIGVFVQISFLTFPVIKILSDAFGSQSVSHIEKIESTGRRLLKRFLVIGTVLVVLALWPSRYHIDRQGVILYSKSEFISTQAGGLVSAVMVKTGDWVEADTLLIKFENPSLESDLKIAQIEYDMAKLQYGALQNERSWQNSRQIAEAAAALEIAATRQKRVIEKMNLLDLKAPIAGYILTADPHRLKGKYIAPEQNLLRIGVRESTRMLLPLTEDEVQLIEPESKVTGRWNTDGEKFETRLDVFPRQKAPKESYSAAMLAIFGGPAPQEITDSNNGSIASNNDISFALFIAEAPLTAQKDYSVLEGMRVQATIEGKKTTLGGKFRRAIIAFWDNRIRSFR